MVKRKAPDWHWYRDGYLSGRHWAKVRADALIRAAHRCQLCGASDVGLNVHHNNYERLYAERPSDVIALCRKCHETFHAAGEITRVGATVGFDDDDASAEHAS